MESAGINWLAVIASTIAYMVLGALWYSPALFGKAWMSALGKTEEEIKAQSSPLNYIWALILSFIAAYGIARILNWIGDYSVSRSIIVSLLAGICFVLTTMGVNDIFEGKSRSLTAINVLYHIIGFFVIGLILGIWR